jgi:hypothetical protein
MTDTLVEQFATPERMTNVLFYTAIGVTREEMTPLIGVPSRFIASRLRASAILAAGYNMPTAVIKTGAAKGITWLTPPPDAPLWVHERTEAILEVVTNSERSTIDGGTRGFVYEVASHSRADRRLG